jgi:NAD-dependent deacetylase
VKCRKFYSAEYIKESQGIPHCECGGIIKPDVVLYEEGLDNTTVNSALSAIQNADTLIIAGTSLTVYPAAGFVSYFRGENLILINRDETPMDKAANLVFHDKVGELLSKIKVN